MNPFSESPYKPGTAEDMTWRMAQHAQANDPDKGKGVETIANGLGYLLTRGFHLVVFAFRSLFRGIGWTLTYGTLTRWTVVGAVFGCAFGLFLSLAMRDEILRAQVRTVPLGAVLGFLLGLAKVAIVRRGT